MTDTVEPRRRGPDLHRGYRRIRLIRELALGEKTQVELANEYNVDQATVSRFHTRYKAEIENYSDMLADMLDGIWIADKGARLAELAEDVDRINAYFDADVITAVQEWIEAETDPTLRAQRAQQVAKSALQDPRVLAVKHKALELAAKEVGGLTERHEHEILTYRVEGVSVEDLK